MSTDEPDIPPTAPDGRPLTRRELRELRERQDSERELRERQERERAEHAQGETQVDAPAVAATSTTTADTPATGVASAASKPAVRRTSALGSPATPTSPGIPVVEPTVTPPGGTPSRRSMRERRPDAPAGRPGLGERLPATGSLPTRAGGVVEPPVVPVPEPPVVPVPAVVAPEEAPAAPARPAVVPTVPTPAAAQAVREVDETGALSEIRTTRASEDSPVEVTGPIDWSSTTQPAVVPPKSAAPKEATPARPPSRRSVLARESSAPSWAPVTGEGGANVPTPSYTPPPPVAEAFEPVLGSSPASSAAEPAKPARSERRGFSWFSPLGYLLLALVGVGIGVGLYVLVLR